MGLFALFTPHWHYQRGEDSIGPVSYRGIHDLIKSGDITHDTLMWSVGKKQWYPAAKVFPNIFRKIPPPINQSSPEKINRMFGKPKEIHSSKGVPPLPGKEGQGHVARPDGIGNWTGGAWAGLIISSLVIPLIGIILGIIYLSSDIASAERKRQAKVLLIIGSSVIGILFILSVMSQIIFEAFR